jgi:hypothetical protein
MATTTNYGWDTPDDTDLVKDGALAMRDLGQDVDTSLFGITKGKNVGLVPLATATLSGSSGISFSNFVTSDYSHYKLIYKILGTVGAFAGIRVRQNVTDFSGSAYYFATWSATVTGVTTTFVNNGNPSNIANVTRLGSTLNLSSFDFSTDGALSVFTGTSWDPYNFGTSHSAIQVAGTTAVTGISIIPTTGTLTGEVQIYGYRKP